MTATTETNLQIITNNVPRHIIYGFELTEEERKDFDYLDSDESETRQFARYRGHLYDIGDFITTSPGPWNHGLPTEFSKWDGYQNDSYFSGILIRYPREQWGDINTESVIFATYYT